MNDRWQPNTAQRTTLSDLTEATEAIQIAHDELHEAWQELDETREELDEARSRIKELEEENAALRGEVA